MDGWKEGKMGFWGGDGVNAVELGMGWGRYREYIRY